MDPLFLISASILLVFMMLVSISIYRLFQKESKPEIHGFIGGAARTGHNRGGGHRRIIGGQRQAAVRHRVVRNESEESEKSDDEELTLESGQAEGKIGKKKLAKLHAKADKRAAREAELQEREEKKRRDAERFEEEKAKEEKERKEELAREEERKRLLEEKKQREHEEYLKLKAEFTVEEQGCEADQTLNDNNVFRRFVSFIKESKVVNIDELAAHFRLRSQEAIDRLHQLLADGILTGVIDDRGKFIYITENEMRAVAKFITQRGRVSVDELMEYSNKLIRFEPEGSVQDVACQ